MMLAALLFMQVPMAVTPPDNDDVVVTARKLGNLNIEAKTDKKTGETYCRFKRRSGDPELDAGVCTALLACVPKMRTKAEVRACMTPAIQALLPKAKHGK